MVHRGSRKFRPPHLVCNRSVKNVLVCWPSLAAYYSKCMDIQKPKSTKLQYSKAARNASSCRGGAGLQLSFSDELNISLKSPIHIQAPSTREQIWGGEPRTYIDLVFLAIHKNLLVPTENHHFQLPSLKFGCLRT